MISGLPAGLDFDGLKPWAILDSLPLWFEQLGQPKKIRMGNVFISGNVWIEDKVKVLGCTVIEGPVYIGRGAVIGPHAYLRPYSVIGDEVRIGHSTEVKDSVIGKNSRASHFAYIGDSVIGSSVNLAAGVKLANLRFDRSEIEASLLNGNRISSGRQKFGAVIGDKSQIGVNCVTMPGTVIGLGCTIWPGAMVRGTIPVGTVVKSGDKKYVI